MTVLQVPKFISTLILCGLVTLIPAEGASQVFIALVTSVGMMMLFSNCNPYTNGSDDVLAQFCQLSLTLALSIGLLEKASESFQDAFFGILPSPLSSYPSFVLPSKTILNEFRFSFLMCCRTSVDCRHHNKPGIGGHRNSV